LASYSVIEKCKKSSRNYLSMEAEAGRCVMMRDGSNDLLILQIFERGIMATWESVVNIMTLHRRVQACAERAYLDWLWGGLFPLMKSSHKG
jgi:hypothetical protein